MAMRYKAKPAFLDNFGGRKSEDFAENLLPRISMFTSSRCWSDFGRISQQIRGFQIDYECGLIDVSSENGVGARDIFSLIWLSIGLGFI
jgi:hypothetical protein